jgi:hypothetical protein
MTAATTLSVGPLTPAGNDFFVSVFADYNGPTTGPTSTWAGSSNVGIRSATATLNILNGSSSAQTPTASQSPANDYCGLVAAVKP